VIGTIGAFGTSWLRSEIKTILANDLAEIQENLLKSARADKEALLESARKDKEELRSEINGCNNKTFELALSVIKSPDKSTVTTEYLEKKFVPLSEFQELEERVSKLEDGGGPQIETQEHKIED
jgi:Na+/phosphate symporter